MLLNCAHENIESLMLRLFFIKKKKFSPHEISYF